MCSKSEQNSDFMTNLQPQNLHQTVVNTFLSINISNSNNLDKFWEGIFTCHGHINQVYFQLVSKWVNDKGSKWLDSGSIIINLTCPLHRQQQNPLPVQWEALQLYSEERWFPLQFVLLSTRQRQGLWVHFRQFRQPRPFQVLLQIPQKPQRHPSLLVQLYSQQSWPSHELDFSLCRQMFPSLSEPEIRVMDGICCGPNDKQTSSSTNSFTPLSVIWPATLPAATPENTCQWSKNDSKTRQRYFFVPAKTPRGPKPAANIPPVVTKVEFVHLNMQLLK